MYITTNFYKTWVNCNKFRGSKNSLNFKFNSIPIFYLIRIYLFQTIKIKINIFCLLWLDEKLYFFGFFIIIIKFWVAYFCIKRNNTHFHLSNIALMQVLKLKKLVCFIFIRYCNNCRTGMTN